MPRTARLVVAGMPHHIVQRGHNRNVVFVEDADYIYYLENLQELKQEFGIKVYAWCLMTNHVHLVLQPEEDNQAIGQLMKRLAGRQTRYVNKQEKRTGSLWEGRYKLSIIDRDAYLLQCCRYVELNPVKAAMVIRAEDYSWSSYQAKIGLSDSGLLDFDPCYQALKQPKIQYKQFVEEGISDAEHSFIAERLSRNQLTGGSKFMKEIEARTGVRLVARSPGRPKNKSVPVFYRQYGAYHEEHFGKLLILIAENTVGHRPGRTEPREVKRRPKEYKFMTEPRHIIREKLRQNDYPRRQK